MAYFIKGADCKND